MHYKHNIKCISVKGIYSKDCITHSAKQKSSHVLHLHVHIAASPTTVKSLLVATATIRKQMCRYLEILIYMRNFTHFIMGPDPYSQSAATIGSAATIRDFTVVTFYTLQLLLPLFLI